MNVIRNSAELARTPQRADALRIAEAGYAAIATDTVIRNVLSLDSTTLMAKDRSYDLSMFKRIKVIGFGKVACRASQCVESILKERITEGIAIDVAGGVCDIVDVREGQHPLPSKQNVAHTKGIVEMAQSEESDLVIVIVSGGGSSLLCWPESECDQGIRLFEDQQRVGMTITELNTIRKHISEIKGGGLAQMLYPATVIALVFCDIPGDNYENVASGPTYFDTTTVHDAEVLLENYGLSGYNLRETPKNKALFERVQNIPVVSNRHALNAMEACAKNLGYSCSIMGDALYDAPEDLAVRMMQNASQKSVVLAGAEPRIAVTGENPKGGRSAYTALMALKHLEYGVFLAFASDGVDNSNAAGALADTETRRKADVAGLSLEEHATAFRAYPFFEATNDLLHTGSLESNVSDLFVYLRA